MAEVEAPEVPSQTEAPVDVLSDDTPAASELDTEPESVPESPAKKETAKENVPPKRAPGLVAKRPGTSSSSASKTAAPTATKSLGGLSKPPTRPAAGSTVRKPATSTTAPSTSTLGHRTRASIGGSGDEKKPLASAARRTSLATVGSHHTPAKTETLAEKRGAPASTSTVRKPTSSISSSTSKPVVKPATTSSTTRATGSTPTVKAAVSGAVTDVKKKLSTISGSPVSSRPSTARPSSHAASGSTSSKEVDELKAKLADSEIRVEGLQKEITLSQEKLLELGKQMEEEASKVNAAEESIRIQHNDLIEKAHAAHKADVETLKAQLADREIAQKQAQEASLKAIEEVQQAAASKGSSETAEATEKLSAEYASALEAVKAELASAKEASAATASALSKQEDEITSLKQQIEAAKAEVVDLKAEHESKRASLMNDHEVALSDLKKSLGAEHESTLSALKSAHSSELAKGSTDASSAHDQQIADLAAKHDSTAKGLQKQLEEAIAASAALDASHKQKFEAQQADSATAVSKLNKDIADLQTSSQSTQTQLDAATKKHGSLESAIAEHEKSAQATNSELAKREQDIQALQAIMDEDGKTKDELHSKVKADLVATSKSLEEKTKELSVSKEKHRKELEVISADYQAEIDALQGNTGVKEELEALKVNHEKVKEEHAKLLKDHEELEQTSQNHEKQAKSLQGLAGNKEKLDALQTKHDELIKTYDAARSIQAGDLDRAKQAYAAVVVASDNKDSAHLEALEELKATHAKNLDETHDKAFTAGDDAHAAELEQLHATHSDAIAALKKEHSASLAGATSDSEKSKGVEAKLQSELEKTHQSLATTQKELDDLKEQFAMEKMARATAEADLDATKSKKPDTSEADTLRKELQSLKDQHQAALMTAQQESAKATEEHLSVRAALEKNQSDLENHKADAATRSKTYEADYKQLNTSMTELVEEAHKKAADAEARLNEAEANLKVKNAELAEAQAKSVASSLKTPTKPQGLAASRFADPVDEPEVEPEAVEGEQDRSSAALASLAKASLTLQQLDQMNEDLQRDNLRSLESITDVSSASN